MYVYIILCTKKDKQNERDKERERDIYNAHCNRLAVCAQPPQDRKGYALNPTSDAKPSSNFAVRPWVTIINRLLARIPRACLSASEEISISYQRAYPPTPKPLLVLLTTQLPRHLVHSISLSTQVQAPSSLGRWGRGEVVLLTVTDPETSTMIEQTHSQLNNIT
jgi:hypothetical protein